MSWQDTPCIPWTGIISEKGYGLIYVTRRSKKVAHVVEWEKVNGPVPTGLVLDHLCRNRCCVNVNHLEPVTNKENVLRGVGPTAVNAKKTHCLRGHPFEGENLQINKHGHRMCKECLRGQNQMIRYKKRCEAVGVAPVSVAEHIRLLAMTWQDGDLKGGIEMLKSIMRVISDPSILRSLAASGKEADRG